MEDDDVNSLLADFKTQVDALIQTKVSELKNDMSVIFEDLEDDFTVDEFVEGKNEPKPSKSKRRRDKKKGKKKKASETAAIPGNSSQPGAASTSAISTHSQSGQSKISSAEQEELMSNLKPLHSLLDEMKDKQLTSDILNQHEEDASLDKS